MQLVTVDRLEHCHLFEFRTKVFFKDEETRSLVQSREYTPRMATCKQFIELNRIEQRANHFKRYGESHPERSISVDENFNRAEFKIGVPCPTKESQIERFFDDWDDALESKFSDLAHVECKGWKKVQRAGKWYLIVTVVESDNPFDAFTASSIAEDLFPGKVFGEENA